MTRILSVIGIAYENSRNGADTIGSNLVSLLCREGMIITVFDNLVSGYRGNLSAFPQVRLVVGDIRTFRFCARLATPN